MAATEQGSRKVGMMRSRPRLDLCPYAQGVGCMVGTDDRPSSVEGAWNGLWAERGCDRRCRWAWDRLWHLRVVCCCVELSLDGALLLLELPGKELGAQHGVGEHVHHRGDRLLEGIGLRSEPKSEGEWISAWPWACRAQAISDKGEPRNVGEGNADERRDGFRPCTPGGRAEVEVTNSVLDSKPEAAVSVWVQRHATG
jgi:hypothetical protein